MNKIRTMVVSSNAGTVTLSKEGNDFGADPLTKLIKRAEAFRETLIDASSKVSSYPKDSLKSDPELLHVQPGRFSQERESVSTFDKLLETLLIEEPGVDNGDVNSESELHSKSLDLDIWGEAGAKEFTDVAEAALLQELFFSDRSPSNAAAANNLKGDAIPSNKRNKAFATQFPKEEGLHLLVTIGKLVISEPTLKDFTKLKTSIPGHLGNNTSVLPNCSCLLTLFFPAVFDVNGCKLCPEQRISISPVKIEKRMVFFDYKSQLFWKLRSGKARDEWWIQPVKTTVHLRWQSGEVLECYGYISLKNSIGSASAGFQTSLVLVGAKGIDDNLLKDSMLHNHEPVKASERKKKPSAEGTLSSHANRDVEGRPVAIVDIGMTLMGELEIPKQVPLSVEPQEEQEPWVYLNLHSLISFFTKFTTPVQNQSMLLVINSGSTITFRTIRPLSHKGGSDRHYDHKYLDAVLQPMLDRESVIFLEVWRNWRAYEGLTEEGLADLIGMVKVPYSLETWKERKGRQGTVKFSGKFAVWHPNRNSVGGKVAVVAVLGLRLQILRMQRENHAAALIQCFVRHFLNDRHSKSLDQKQVRKVQPKLSVQHTLKNRKSLDNQITREAKARKGAMSWHVFEVNVQKLVGLPEAVDDQQTFSNGRLSFAAIGQESQLLISSSGFLGKIFIKYLFPGEEEPLYTPESDWLQTIAFEASVHHRISLPSDASVTSYFRTIDRKSEGLRFEIWQTSESGQPQADHNEEHLGTAILCQASLLSLLSSKGQNSYDNHKIKQLFQLPISIHANWLSGVLLDPKLIVEVAYHHVEFSEDLLKGTIFADNSSTFGPVEAVLDVKIIRAKSLQDAVDVIVSTRAPWEGSVNPYVRFSLFPSNRELELLYSPSLTPFKESTTAPYYGWSTTLLVTMTADVVNELKKSKMNFEVWHHSSKARKSSSLSSFKSLETDIWLATASAPCSTLLSDKKGVNGWLTLRSRKGEIAGKLEVEIKFASWQRLR